MQVSLSLLPSNEKPSYHHAGLNKDTLEIRFSSLYSLMTSPTRLSNVEGDIGQQRNHQERAVWTFDFGVRYSHSLILEGWRDYNINDQ